MTSVVRKLQNPGAMPNRAQRLLYVGPAADEICGLLAPQIGRIDTVYQARIQDALDVARRSQFDVVMVDQRDRDSASKLILPLMSTLGYPVKLVVISPLSDVSHYLSMPGVARVLAAPVREGQLLRVLGLERRVSRGSEPEAENARAKEKPVAKKSIVQLISDRFMSLVSTAYKRAAFVLLLALFLSFTFYGVLIGYFLISSSWGAPMTLARGHEMVNKVEGQITELRVALTQNQQHLTDANLEKVKAERELSDAKVLVRYATGTVDKEIKARLRQKDVLTKGLQRKIKARNLLEKQLAGGGMSADLDKLYKKRLIDRNAYSSATLGIIEAQQRLGVLVGEVELAEVQIESIDVTVEMLRSLKKGLESGGPMNGLNAAPTDLLLLTKQAVDARAAHDIAISKLESAAVRIQQLTDGQKVILDQIAELEKSSLARAITSRVDVVFVPYNNRQRFIEGTPLYSCVLTIFFCHQAGTVGAVQPGEINAVHPFFGKPIRGYFVEAHLTDPEAATKEIIHGTRAPFFF